MKLTSDSVEEEVISLLFQLWRPDLASNPVLKEEWESKFDPGFYADSEALSKDYVLYSLLRKWKGHIKSGKIPRDAAFKTWLACEHQNAKTNNRLKSEMADCNYGLPLSIILDAKRKVSQVLGHVNWDLLSALCRFGNGATSTLKRGATHADKSLRPSITADAIPYACIVLTDDAWLQDKIGGLRDLNVVRSNRMEMVPKTSKTHRPIACEPTLNSFIQQGLGRYIRMRLKKFGVDLDDQTINQDLARRAYSDGLSTIDLSSASDTLSRALVELLLPPSWYEIFDSLRSKFTAFEGKTYYLEKFSSMGNAFTFELESLIFWALCSASSESDWCAVYGDDIVCKRSDAEKVIATLNWAGFNVNSDKSFIDGNFFESCGKHFFRGIEVTPCFQKDVSKRPVDYIRFHNRLMRASLRLGLPEVELVCAHVRDFYRRTFARSPELGPLVEYDEFFINPSFDWGERDRVRLWSWVTISRVKRNLPSWREEVYLGLKLRTGSNFASDPLTGHVAEPLCDSLRLKRRFHWRSSDAS